MTSDSQDLASEPLAGTQSSKAYDTQDQVWLRLVAAGGRECEKSIEQLFRRYHQPLLVFLERRGVNPAITEDMVQEVFIRVVKSAATFRGDSKVSSWLFQIAKNLHLDATRKPTEALLDDEAWAAVAANANVSAWCGAASATELSEGDIAQQLQNCFDHGFSQFSRAFPGCGEALDKVVHYGWDVRDIAVFLQRTEGATREHLSQCRKKLRAFVEPCKQFLSN
jgi:RNA polymerase sigma factor (sigma-70 family)